MSQILLSTIIFLSIPLWANEFNKWTFKTDYDSFSITKKEGKYVVGNREVNPNVFAEFEQIFSVDTEYDVGCPQDLGNKPTAIITAHGTEKTISREFFVDKSFVRDKDIQKCLFIMKEGLAHLPLHRSWFIGETNSTIPVKDKLQVYYQGNLVFDFEKDGNHWNQKVDGKFVDWDYFNRVLESLKDFTIDKRYHVSITNEKKQFELRNGREVYTFYLLGRNFWAVKMPKAKWLVGSSTWAVFDDFKPEAWLSKYNSQLLILTDKNSDKDQRSQALYRLGPSWNDSIKQAYHKVLLDPDEDNSLKAKIVLNMKQKPTTENLKVLAKSLTQTEDLELRVEISKVLRIMNPRGPIISLDKPEKIDEQVHEWQKWAEKLK